MSVFPPLNTHFHNTCRCPEAEHLYFSTAFKGYEDKEGAQTDRHMSPATTVFSLRRDRKENRPSIIFLGEEKG